MKDIPGLFCFGLGYSAGFLARDLAAGGWMIKGTRRSRESLDDLTRQGFAAFPFDRDRPLTDPAAALAGVTHVLSSIPPDAEGDPVLDLHLEDLRRLPSLVWVGYLSTTGVYGDSGGRMVDENSPANPTSDRSRRRLAAEIRWLESGLPVHVFRLPGIYGPGSSALDKVRSGEARRILRPGHRFCRIHVEDIAGALKASMARPSPGAIYNVCDDEPAPPAEVTEYACRLLGVEPPPLESYDEASLRMSAMALSFWQDNRLVDNGKIKRELDFQLKFPDYRRGLVACLEQDR